MNIPEQDATAFYFNNSFSTRSWTELRLFLLKFDVNLPPRNLIDNNKHELHPKVISHEIKCSVPYIDLVKDTVSGILDAEKCQDRVPPDASLQLDAKTGIDGSGSHIVRHQIVNLEKYLDENPHLDPNCYKNYLLCCMTPLALNCFDNSGECIPLW